MYKIKFIFEIKLDGDKLLSITLISTDPVLSRYKNIMLYKSYNGFLFHKNIYFRISKNSCILPGELINENNTQHLRFNNDKERCDFLKKFKNNLIELTNSPIFKSNDSLFCTKSIEYYKTFWYVY